MKSVGKGGQQQAGGTPPQLSAAVESCAHATQFNELQWQIAQEELQVATEELIQQNEELVETRQLVEQERARYQDLFQFAPDPYLLTDSNGVIGEANRAVETLFNMPSPFLLGKPLANFIVARDRRTFRWMLLALKIDERREWETCVEGRHGKSADISLTVAAVGQPDGNIILRWMIRDITWRKQAEEALRLAHDELELRVQQRTLELQQANAEKDALLQQQELERARFEAVLRQMPSGVLIADAASEQIVFSNQRDTEIRGTALATPVKLSERMQLSQARLIGDESASPERNQFPLISALRGDEVRNLDLELVRADGQVLQIESNSGPIMDRAGNILAAVAVYDDVTERNQSRRELRESEHRLRLALDVGQIGTLLWNLNSGELTASVQMRRLCGIPDQVHQLSRKAFEACVRLEDRPSVRRFLRRARTQASAQPIECRVVWPDDTVHWLALRAQLFTDGGNKGAPPRLVVVAMDVSTHKMAERELRYAAERLEAGVASRTKELARITKALQVEVNERIEAEKDRQQLLQRLVLAQEDERRRVARELHDELGQHLTALHLGLELVGREIDSRGHMQLKPHVERLQSLTDVLMQQAHRLAWELRPAVLDDLGLPAALKRYAEDWALRHNFEVQFDSVGLDGKRVASEIETALYRIVQEALTNVVRHATASTVSILLEKRADCMLALVEDNGCGFEPQNVAQTNSGQRLGVLGMKERLLLLNGTLTIESAPGAGTTVFASIPLNDRETNSCLPG